MIPVAKGAAALDQIGHERLVRAGPEYVAAGSPVAQRLQHDPLAVMAERGVERGGAYSARSALDSCLRDLFQLRRKSKAIMIIKSAIMLSFATE